MHSGVVNLWQVWDLSRALENLREQWQLPIKLYLLGQEPSFFL